MRRQTTILIVLALLVLFGVASGFYFLARDPDRPKLIIAKAALREIRLLVNTNGIIEPSDRTEIYAPVEGFATAVYRRQGSEIMRGQLLLRLNSEQLRSTLAEANAALLPSSLISTGSAR